MSDRFTLVALLAAALLFGCSDPPPPTSIGVVVTATPTSTTETQQAFLQRFAQSFWEGPVYTCASRANQGARATYDQKWTAHWFFTIDFRTGTMVSVQVNHVAGPMFNLIPIPLAYAVNLSLV